MLKAADIPDLVNLGATNKRLYALAYGPVWCKVRSSEKYKDAVPWCTKYKASPAGRDYCVEPKPCDERSGDINWQRRYELLHQCNACPATDMPCFIVRVTSSKTSISRALAVLVSVIRDCNQ